MERMHKAGKNQHIGKRKNDAAGKWGKRLILQVLGICSVFCTTSGMNPVAAAYFAAMFLERQDRWVLMGIMTVTMAAFMPFLSAAKYILAMLITSIIVCIFESRRSGRMEQLFGASIAGISILTVQAGGALMTNTMNSMLLMGVLEGGLVVALTGIFQIGIHGLLISQAGRPYQNDEMTALGILFAVCLYAFRGVGAFTEWAGPFAMYLMILLMAYRYGIGFGAAIGCACGVISTIWTGDVRMLGAFCVLGVMAGVFRSLGKLGSAVSFLACSCLLGNLYAPFLLNAQTEACLLAGTLVFLLIPRKWSIPYERIKTGMGKKEEGEEKRHYIEEIAGSLKRLAESMGRLRGDSEFSYAAAVQLNETANLLESMCGYLAEEQQEEKEILEQIKQEYKKHRLRVKEGSIVTLSNGRKRIKLLVRTEDRRIFTAKEAAQIAGRVAGKRLCPSNDGRTIINGEYAWVILLEDTNFMVLQGTASLSKDGEAVSGDNFSCANLAEGRYLMGIVDGMGSGELANDESEEVIELLEELIRTGFDEAAALSMVNAVLSSGEEAVKSTAVDLALADLYTGTCSFLKSGAAATFIRRNHWVEVLKSTSLPIGILPDPDCESAAKKLYDGDYIVMLSDGVLEAIDGEEKEEELGRVLMDMKLQNPKEMAEYILDYAIERAGGVPRDDMTVLVTGIWKKAA